MGISLDRLRQCHASLVGVAQFIGTRLIHAAHHEFVPVPQYDQFDKLYDRWLPSAAFDELWEIWRLLSEEAEQWSGAGIGEIQAEIGRTLGGGNHLRTT